MPAPSRCRPESLGRTGTIAGNTINNKRGTISPGVAPGTLNIGTLTHNAGSWWVPAQASAPARNG